MTDFEIRAVPAAEFATAIEWAAAEGWNPGLDDFDAFHAADPQGFYMGYWRGEPVSSISVVRYGAGYGFLGFYIVVPDHRGRGLGLRTWQTALSHLEDRIVGLDGVVDQQDNYRKSGFVLAGRNIRFTGVPQLPQVGANTGPGTNSGVRPIAADDVAAVLAYDRPFFPEDRAAFASAWAAPPAGVHRTGLLATNEDGAITGYGVLRQCRSGYKVGPLFADDDAVASTLFRSLCAEAVAGATVSLDVPEDNAAAVRLAEGAGLSPSFETARMYKGRFPDLPLTRTFGITTFELG